MVLDHEICQLEKLRIWVIGDLPEDCTVIPHNTVLKEKHGPDGEIAPYKVQIIAGEHNQVKGVNYSGIFLFVAKMLTMQVVLANTTT